MIDRTCVVKFRAVNLEFERMSRPLSRSLRSLAKALAGCNDPAGTAVNTNLSIRTATTAEREALEALQLRASLTNEGDREALLANPDAIVIPLEQIAAGRVFVALLSGATVGFSAIEHRSDDDTELDALFVDPNVRRHGWAV